jgi:hypothetical protein
MPADAVRKLQRSAGKMTMVTEKIEREVVLILCRDTGDLVGYQMETPQGLLCFCEKCADPDWYVLDNKQPVWSDPTDPLCCDKCGKEML